MRSFRANQFLTRPVPSSYSMGARAEMGHAWDHAMIHNITIFMSSISLTHNICARFTLFIPGIHTLFLCLVSMTKKCTHCLYLASLIHIVYVMIHTYLYLDHVCDFMYSGTRPIKFSHT